MNDSIILILVYFQFYVFLCKTSTLYKRVKYRAAVYANVYKLHVYINIYIVRHTKLNKNNGLLTQINILKRLLV